jgi:hypothetical protein
MVAYQVDVLLLDMTVEVHNSSEIDEAVGL